MIRKSFKVLVFAIFFFGAHAVVSAAEIEDNIAIQTFKGQNLTKPVFTSMTIEDDAVKNELSNKIPPKVALTNEIIEDIAIKDDAKLKKAIKPTFKYKLIDENAEIIRVPVASLYQLKAGNEINEGQIVTFKVLKTVYKDKKIFIKKGTPVDACIETLTPPSFGGDPAEISIGRFTSTDINGNKIDLTGEIQKQGANRAIWVRPLTDIASNVPVYGTPLLLLYLVKGGNAKISTNQEFVLRYE